MAYEILVVDDEADIRHLVADILQDEGYRVHLAENGSQAISMVKSCKPNLVILDIWLNDSRFDGIEILDVIKKNHPHVPVVMISGHGNIETAVNTIKKGAFDFIEKPFTFERLLLIVKRAIEMTHLKHENEDLKRRLDEGEEYLGNSLAAQTVRSQISKLAPTNSRIHITGPTGSGKEYIARLIHAHSGRHGPFVTLDCRGHTPEGFEEALLGREMDPLNPLAPSYVGCIEEARSGTLYLDHVGDIPQSFQSKLVRILHNSVFERVGGQTKIKLDARIISSYTDPLDILIKQGLFREDLFFRLNVMSIKIPPLYQRTEDILMMVEHFIEQGVKHRSSSNTIVFTEEAKNKILDYVWSGNVRQVKNFAEWILILAQDSPSFCVQEEMLPPEITHGTPSVLALDGGEELMKLPLREAREIFERQYLASQIIRFGHNISKTADFVGMERSALHRKLRSLGLNSANLSALIPETSPEQAATA